MDISNSIRNILIKKYVNRTNNVLDREDYKNELEELNYSNKKDLDIEKINRSIEKVKFMSEEEYMLYMKKEKDFALGYDDGIIEVSPFYIPRVVKFYNILIKRFKDSIGENISLVNNTNLEFNIIKTILAKKEDYVKIHKNLADTTIDNILINKAKSTVLKNYLRLHQIVNNAKFSMIKELANRIYK